jgi:molybdate transport system substrate-binding protein
MRELLAVAIIASVIPTMADAAELKVIAGGSMTAPLNKISPEFETASGHKLSIHFDSTPNIIARVNAGTPFDFVVLPVDVFKDAAARAHFAPGPTVDIARVGYGVIVRAGAPRPDISTPEAFKQAMLAAPSLAFLPSSAAGAYITKVFERLGIAEEMKTKTKVQADAAKALIDYLRSPAATAVIGAAGMTPG